MESLGEMLKASPKLSTDYINQVETDNDLLKRKLLEQEAAKEEVKLQLKEFINAKMKESHRVTTTLEEFQRQLDKQAQVSVEDKNRLKAMEEKIAQLTVQNAKDINRKKDEHESKGYSARDILLGLVPSLLKWWLK